MDDLKITKEEQNIIDSAKDVVLSVSEKNDIKNKLITYTNAHPIYNTNKTSIFAKFDFIYHRNTYLIPALAVVLLVIGLNSTQNNSGQISSLEKTSTEISGEVTSTESFDMKAFSTEIVDDQELSEPIISEDTNNVRMMNIPPEDNAVMMMAAVEISTSTEEEDEDENKNKINRKFEKIKDQLGETYNYFIDRIFRKSKDRDTQEDNERFSTTTEEDSRDESKKKRRSNRE